MHYSRHRLTASVAHVTTRQPMTSRLALLAHCSVRQKQNRVSSVQLRRSERAFTVHAVLVSSIYSDTQTAVRPRGSAKN